ncbi:Hypothetical predicted protein [Podarcis lilfordi]|uniref:Uncharacterized protein n=1 Tax=Podarcis lilfordi TaxID=74358 RepID=A0AA35PRH4_9SAUR|nr:Hypothetical predicted protein [Podarcis lilfordi]
MHRWTSTEPVKPEGNLHRAGAAMQVHNIPAPPPSLCTRSLHPRHPVHARAHIYKEGYMARQPHPGTPRTSLPFPRPCTPRPHSAAPFPDTRPHRARSASVPRIAALHAGWNKTPPARLPLSQL